MYEVPTLKVRKYAFANIRKRKEMLSDISIKAIHNVKKKRCI